MPTTAAADLDHPPNMHPALSHHVLHIQLVHLNAPVPCTNVPAGYLKWIENMAILLSPFALNSVYYQHLWEFGI